MSFDSELPPLPSNVETLKRFFRPQRPGARPARSRSTPPCLGLTWDQVLDGQTHIFPIGYEGSPWKNHDSLRGACYREAAKRALGAETHLYGEGHFEVRAYAIFPPGSAMGSLAPVLYHSDEPVWHNLPGVPAANQGQWYEDRPQPSPAVQSPATRPVRKIPDWISNSHESGGPSFAELEEMHQSSAGGEQDPSPQS